jgi:hypothetical protein
MPASAAEPPNTLNNGGFEAPLGGSWTVSGGAGDKRVCGTTDPVPTVGTCLFRFKGGPTVTSLTQTVDAQGLQLFNNTVACGGGFLEPFLNFYSISESDVPTIKIVAKFTDGLSTYNLKVNDRPILFPLMAWNNQHNVSIYVPPGATAQKLTFTIRHSSTSGKMYVDQAQLNISSILERAC